MSKKRALGKGLGALLQSSETDITTKKNEENTSLGNIANLEISKIEVNPFNPRTNFEEEPLSELSNSIKQHGIIQPITVRKMGYDKYQIISGERRFRASQLAGLTEVPAYIRVTNDQTMVEMALVENIQREDLDAMEISLSYQRLIEECNLTQEELSKKVAKKRSTITNYLRLLKLPAEIQIGIRTKKISMGHARTLVGLDNENQQLEIYGQILSKNLSVRQVEELVKSTKEDKKEKTIKPAPSKELNKIGESLNQFFGTKVDLKRAENGKGKISINFKNDDEFKKIIKTLNLNN